MSATAPPAVKAGAAPAASTGDLEPKRNKLAFWLLLPATVLMLVVQGYPIVNMVILSLQEAKLRNITRGTQSWNNFANYTKILGDPYFWEVVVRTLVITVACVVGTMVLGTLVALLLNKLGTKMRLFTLVGLLLAWATPAVTATQTWQFLFDTQFGVVNWALVQLGFDQFEGYSWLTNPLSLLTLMGCLSVWGRVFGERPKLDKKAASKRIIVIFCVAKVRSAPKLTYTPGDVNAK